VFLLFQANLRRCRGSSGTSHTRTISNYLRKTTTPCSSAPGKFISIIFPRNYLHSVPFSRTVWSKKVSTFLLRKQLHSRSAFLDCLIKTESCSIMRPVYIANDKMPIEQAVTRNEYLAASRGGPHLFMNKHKVYKCGGKGYVTDSVGRRIQPHQ